jgi:hypothetical protein
MLWEQYFVTDVNRIMNMLFAIPVHQLNTEALVLLAFIVTDRSFSNRYLLTHVCAQVAFYQLQENSHMTEAIDMFLCVGVSIIQLFSL